MSKITRYCISKEEKTGPNVFEVCRPNIFGNPYTHIKDKQTLASIKVRTRDDAIAAYEPYFDAMLKDKSEAGDLFRAEWDRMYQAYKEYDEIFIGCFCPLDLPCHGDIIKKKLLQRSMKEKLEKLKSD